MPKFINNGVLSHILTAYVATRTRAETSFQVILYSPVMTRPTCLSINLSTLQRELDVDNTP
jgi:hypothetical protein